MSDGPQMMIFGPRRGRKPRAEAPSKPLRTRLSPDERALAEKAAAANHQSISAFVRDAIVTAAADCLEATPSE